MSRSHAVARAVAVSFLCLAPCFASWATDADDIAALKRAIEALREENRALAKRLATLEAEKSERGRGKDPEAPTATVGSAEQERLEQRVKELEAARIAQEDAVRSIVRDSVATLGSKINEAVSLGGVIEVIPQRTKDFSGNKQSLIQLGSTLEFDIQTSEWVLGKLQIDYVDGTNALFPTTEGVPLAVDRFNLDLGYFTLGNTQKFPPFLTAGRMVLPFGISTGRPIGDVLSIVTPLTVEIFETRANAIGFGLAFPTPALKPSTPPVTPPPVRPLAINPLISSLSKGLGYDPPPTRLKPPPPITFAPTPAPFDAGIYFYDGVTTGGPGKHIDATLGFNTRGHCGRAYDQLRWSDLCPWTLAVDVNYNSSVFDSRFLQTEYRAFLDQIGRVPGMAATVRASLGPVAFVGEWNSALKQARFLNGLGEPVAIKPAAWQVALSYQFDWNPWVEEIGQQGTYVAIGYSQSSDLAGVTASVNNTATRVGFVPKQRLSLTAGEWVLDTVRVQVEYSRDWDYPRSKGGTGNAAKGLFLALTYQF